MTQRKNGLQLCSFAALQLCSWKVLCLFLKVVDTFLPLY